MYDRMTYAESVGEAPWQRAGYEPSHVFTAADLAGEHPDDLESVMLVTTNDAHRTAARVEDENRRLRAALTQALGIEESALDAHLDYLGGPSEVIAQDLGLD